MVQIVNVTIQIYLVILVFSFLFIIGCRNYNCYNHDNTNNNKKNNRRNNNSRNKLNDRI